MNLVSQVPTHLQLQVRRHVRHVGEDAASRRPWRSHDARLKIQVRLEGLEQLPQSQPIGRRGRCIGRHPWFIDGIHDASPFPDDGLVTFPLRPDRDL
jgi:hypothetical protein